MAAADNCCRAKSVGERSLKCMRSASTRVLACARSFARLRLCVCMCWRRDQQRERLRQRRGAAATAAGSERSLSLLVEALVLRCSVWLSRLSAIATAHRNCRGSSLKSQSDGWSPTSKNSGANARIAIIRHFRAAAARVCRVCDSAIAARSLLTNALFACRGVGCSRHARVMPKREAARAKCAPSVFCFYCNFCRL